MYATTAVNHIGPVYLAYHCQLYLLHFISIFKVTLKNIKWVIPEEDVFDVIHEYHNMNNHSRSKTTYHHVRLHGIFGLPYFLQVFSISASRSDSDSEL